MEYVGKNLEEAIASAAASLNLPPEKVKFSLLTMGSKGFLGLGRRQARISVDPADPDLALGDEKNPGQPPVPAAEKPAKAAQAPKPGPKPEPLESGRNNRAGRPPQAARPAEGQVEIKALNWAHLPPPPTEPGPGETELVNPPDDAASLLAETVVREIIGRMGFSVQCRRLRLGSRLVVSLDSPDNALLIGNRGSALEALQLLASKIFRRRTGPRMGPYSDEDRLLLDVAGYRARRQAQLLENLKNVAEETRHSGQSQTLGALNSAERGLVRLALRPFKDLAVSSGGGRDGLTLTIAPTSGHRPPRPPRRPHRPHRPRRGPGPQKSP